MRNKLSDPRQLSSVSLLHRPPPISALSVETRALTLCDGSRLFSISYKKLSPPPSHPYHDIAVALPLQAQGQALTSTVPMDSKAVMNKAMILLQIAPHPKLEDSTAIHDHGTKMPPDYPPCFCMGALPPWPPLYILYDLCQQGVGATFSAMTGNCFWLRRRHRSCSFRLQPANGPRDHASHLYTAAFGYVPSGAGICLRVLPEDVAFLRAEGYLEWNCRPLPGGNGVWLEAPSF